jgi:hypothetical protein
MKSSPAPLRADALPYIERMIDSWCERRAIGPLRWILTSAYPGLYHTDHWLTVLDALKTIKGLCHEQLTQEEMDWLRKALWILQEIFEPLEVVNAIRPNQTMQRTAI